MFQPKREFMEAAIKEALKSKELGDYAVGAVIVKDDKIIAKAGDRIILDKDATNHAEVIAIREASKILGTRFLEDCILYTTHEPCPMCAAAAVWAKMKGIVYGARMEDMADHGKRNANERFSWRTIDIPCSAIIERGNPKLFLVGWFMREECKKLFHS